MSKTNITKEVLDNKTLINKFKSKSKYFFDSRFSIVQSKLIDINENYRLDCGEFDDNIEKSSKKVEKFYKNVINDVNNFDSINGINYYNNKLEEEKKTKIKEFVDKLNDEKNEITHKISLDDKDYDANHKEKNDALFQLEKESKAKIQEIKKKLNVDLSKEEYNGLKKCDVIEKSLLATNDREEIKKLLEEQKQIRLETLNNIYEIKSKYYQELKELKTLQATQKIDGIIDSSKFKMDCSVIRNKNRRDIDEIIEKIKMREEFYLYNSSIETVNYFNEQIDSLEKKKSKANEDGYLVEKEILTLKMKQIKFIEKEFGVVYKNYSGQLIELLDEYFENVKVIIDIYRKYYNYFDPKFKSSPDDPKNQKELFNLINNINNAVINHNNIFSEKVVGIIEEKVKYIDYSFQPLKDEIVNYINEQNQRIKNICDTITQIKNIEGLEESYREGLKELFSVSNSFGKDIKNIFKNYGAAVKEYISQYCNDLNLTLNNDTIKIDEKFTNCCVIDNSCFDILIESYKKQVDSSNEIVNKQKLILEKIGITPTKNLEEKNKKLEIEFQGLVNTNKKSLSETLKTIDKDYKNSMVKCEQNRKELIARL